MKFYRKSWPERLWPKEARQAKAERESKERRAHAREAAKTDEERRLETLIKNTPPHALADPETARIIRDARERLREIRE